MIEDDVKIVKIGEIAIGQAAGSLACIGVGSCIIIILYHPPTKIGGFAHIILPSKEFASNNANPLRFPEEALGELLNRMKDMGAVKSEMWSKIVGGASLFAQLSARSIGTLNVRASRDVLAKSGIPIIAEDVLGNSGRSVYLNLNDGTVRVRKIGGEDKIL